MIADYEKITLELPDEIARQLAVGQDVSRAALEGLVAEGCRSHRLSDHQAAQLLGLSRYELDGFLKAHGVFLDYSMEDFEREAAFGERLWQERQAELGTDLSGPLAGFPGTLGAGERNAIALAEKLRADALLIGLAAAKLNGV
jgi:Uncharacterised protein family (UPF0175)